MTISEALKKYRDIEIEILLGHILKKPKEFLYANPSRKLTETQRKKIILLTNYRQHGIPIAYLLGYKYFYNLKFKVNRNVLIPRPETEWIVDKALEFINSKKGKVDVIDVGTGSGAIAISIAVNAKRKSVQITALDISRQALTVTKQNAKQNKVHLNYIQSDLLKNVKNKYDLVIANLPYVPKSDYKKFFNNLKYEPKLALTDETDDFKLIKRFIEQLPNYLTKDGIALLEIDPKASTIKTPGFKKEVIKDLNGLKRFIVLSQK